MLKKLKLLSSIIHIFLLSSCTHPNISEKNHIGYKKNAFYSGQKEREVLELKESLKKGYESSSEAYNVYIYLDVEIGICSGYEYTLSSSYTFKKKQKVLDKSTATITFQDSEISIDTMKRIFNDELSKMFYINEQTSISYETIGFRSISLSWEKGDLPQK